MARESPVQTLCEELTCPICLGFFREPVMLDCGHNFCQRCIGRCFGDAGAEAACPQCRARVRPHKTKPNRPLGNIVEISRSFSLLGAGCGAKALGRVCEGHQEPLKLFCDDDQALICVACDRSREHRGHKVIPQEEALEKYQNEVSKHLNVLREKREAIVSSRRREETEKQKLLRQTESERQKIVAEFRQMHEFLEEQERKLLVQLKQLENKVEGIGDTRIAELTEEIESIEGSIKKMEEKQKQPAYDFLQGIGSTLNSKRNDNRSIFRINRYITQQQMEQIKTFSTISVSLTAVMKEFKDSFTNKLLEKDGSLQYPPFHEEDGVAAGSLTQTSTT